MSSRGISPLRPSLANGVNSTNGPGNANGGVAGGGGGGSTAAYLRQQQQQQQRQLQELPSPEESANTTTVMMMASAQSHNVHAAIQPGRVAVITGASCGIGRAAAREFVRSGFPSVISSTSPISSGWRADRKWWCFLYLLVFFFLFQISPNVLEIR
jgi:threonine dehydrogenase-like Zn-dependent dehydrogenase